MNYKAMRALEPGNLAGIVATKPGTFLKPRLGANFLAFLKFSSKIKTGP